MQPQTKAHANNNPAAGDSQVLQGSWSTLEIDNCALCYGHETGASAAHLGQHILPRFIMGTKPSAIRCSNTGATSRGLPTIRECAKCVKRSVLQKGSS